MIKTHLMTSKEKNNKGDSDNMIRKLTEQDRKQVLDYLQKEPSINLFMIGDIENYGFDHEIQDVYAEFKNENIISVFLRYKEALLYYSQDLYFNPEWLEIVEGIKHLFFSAKKSLVELIKKEVTGYTEKPMYFCEAKSINPEFKLDESDIILSQTEEDAGLNFDLLHSIEEFDGFKHQKRDEYIESKMKDTSESVTYYIKKDGVCASTVSTTADTSVSSMVVGVATHLEHRQKGYASKLMVKLMDEYINKRNKYLCLFYDNPKAGKIYHRLGFKDIDMWVTLKKDRD